MMHIFGVGSSAEASAGSEAEGLLAVEAGVPSWVLRRSGRSLLVGGRPWPQQLSAGGRNWLERLLAWRCC